MSTHFTRNSPDFAARFQRFLQRRDDNAPDVRTVVAAIIKRVRAEGDAALIALTEQFDRQTLRAIRPLEESVIAQARAACPASVLAALELASDRIRRYHERQLPQDAKWCDEDGVTLGWRWGALDAVGLYVPGGTASYPSSVLMNAIPAQVAGVARRVLTVPMPDGVANSAVLAAASLAGITEIYPIGGAQAVAALAYGTESIQAVDKVVGPGNAYVAEAKRQVFGHIGIDMIAGPSEILVVADAGNAPDRIAADLLSQSEHDAQAQSLLITDDAAFAGRVEEAIRQMLATHPRAAIAAAAWRDHGAVILVQDLLRDAPAIIDHVAPEHLELALAEPEALAARVRHAGAIFLGRYAPEAVGDYIAGPSHVLPTSRTARFSSGLGVLDFMKRTSLIGCEAGGLARIGEAAALLADTEGLPSHALSLRLRL